MNVGHDAVELEDTSPDDGSAIFGSTDCGRRILEPEEPWKFLTNGLLLERKPLWDVESCSLGALVSPDFRAIVEKLEPGVHQFIDVEIYAGYATRKKAPDRVQDHLIRVEKKTWAHPVMTRDLFVICNRLDTMDRSASYPITEKGFWDGRNHSANSHLAVKRSAFADRHFWWDKFVMDRFMSNAAAEMVEALGIRGLNLLQFDET